MEMNGLVQITALPLVVYLRATGVEPAKVVKDQVGPRCRAGFFFVDNLLVQTARQQYDAGTLLVEPGAYHSALKRTQMEMHHLLSGEEG